MVQKAAIVFETVKGEGENLRTYQFLIPVGSPFGEVFDVAFEMLAAAENLSKEAIEKAKKGIEEAKEKEAAASVTPELV